MRVLRLGRSLCVTRLTGKIETLMGQIPWVGRCVESFPIKSFRAFAEVQKFPLHEKG